MAVTSEAFRQALGHFASGVTVVTTRNASGQPCGLTASAFTSVSLDPPLILVCIDHQATSHAPLGEHGWFAVHILAKDQEALARRFASASPDKFDGLAYRPGRQGVPLLEEALAVLECRVVHAYPGGDHTIFVGRVEAVRVTGGQPLLYYRGGYNNLG